MKNASSGIWHRVVIVNCGFFHPEDGGDTLFQNVGCSNPHGTKSQKTALLTVISVLQKPSPFPVIPNIRSDICHRTESRITCLSSSLTTKLN
jgi:hypothetical protein